MKKIKLLLAAMAAMTSLGVNATDWAGNAVGAGTFYLYNVAAEKFLNNGDPNQSWGTNAYLQSGFGLDVVLAAKDGGYTIETNVKNNDTDHYLAPSTWCDAGATTWEFRAVDGQTNVYQIVNNGQFLMANEGLNDVEMVGDPGSRTTSTYWKLVTENDFKAAMQAKAYSTTDPMDVSIFIKGRSFNRNDGRNSTWTTTHEGGNWVWLGWCNSELEQKGTMKYMGNESWNNTFDVHQDITGLPDGTYEVRCSGFGTNGTTYIYGNTTSKALQTDNSTARGTNKEAKWQAIHEDNAFAGQSSGTFTIGDGNLRVGIKRETNKSYDWCVYDEFRLYYYGLDLSEFAATLADAVAAAEAVVEGTIPAAAYTALNNVVTEQNKTYTSASAYQAATNAINEATNTAKALQTQFTRYKNVKAAALEINDELELTTAEAQAEAATTVEGLNTAVTTVRTALVTYLAGAGIENDNIDLTAALIDNAAPGTSGKLDYWTNSGTPSLEYNLYEYFNVGSATSKQTIATALPIGYYKMTVIGYTREGHDGFIYAGEKTQTLVGVSKDDVNTRNAGNTWIAAGNGNGVNEMIFNLTEATSNLEIGINSGTVSDYWTVWRSFKLEYLGTAPLVLFQQNLADAATAANAHATELGETIPAGAKTTYTNAISAAAADNSTIDKCFASIAAIETATAAADAAVTSYANYNTLRTAVQALYDVSDYEELTTGSHTTLGNALTTAATDVAAASDAAGIESVTSTLKAAGVTYAGAANPTNSAKFNLTFMLTNPDLTGKSWTKVDGWYCDQNQPTQNSQAMYTEGEGYYYEYWSNNTEATDGYTVYLKATLPVGTYQMKAKAKAGWGGGARYSGGTQDITFSAGDTDGSAITSPTLADAQLDFVQTDEVEVKIGLKAHEGNQSNWMGIGYVELYKVPAVNVTIDETVNYTPESIAGKVTLKRTIKPDVWNTFVVPFQLTNAELRADFGDDVEVAQFSDEGETADAVTVSFTKMATPAITPNKPVLLKTSTGGDNYVFENRTIATSEAKAAGIYFDFVGTYAASTPIAAGDYFIGYSISDGISKLYKSAGETTIQGTRAYLKAKSAGVKAIKFFIDGQDYPTAIDGIEAVPAQNGAIYNIAGQRVSKAQKGIFIVNGKKVVK